MSCTHAIKCSLHANINMHAHSSIWPKCMQVKMQVVCKHMRVCQCIHPALIYYFHPTLILHSSYSHTALILLSYCTHPTLILHSSYSHTALILLSYCTHPTLILHSSYSRTALILHASSMCVLAFCMQFNIFVFQVYIL